ncbi:MAG: proline--tRNA ligase [Thermodesulfobacteriota bacterium]
MRLSKAYIPTLKEDPAEAEIVSHKLLVRAGMIRKVTSGIYTFLPLGLRALDKIANVLREEMERAGCQEIFMPMVQPGDLWKETGRWDYYGKELLRVKDRHERDYCLGPTHEEVVTSLIRGEVRSYRQLPLNLYQIQTKFRDEIRPRFGLMRCREFIMKDAYSFDRDAAGAQESYQTMFDAYTRSFQRLGLQFRAVEADSGAIGGSVSHEFMVLASTGEDTIASCTACEYAANLEKAEVGVAAEEHRRPCEAAASEVPTPGKHTVDEVATFLGVGPERILKTLLYVVDGEVVAVLVRGDRELNETKLKNLLNAQNLELAGSEVVQRVSQAPVGFAGPTGLQVQRLYADLELQNGTDWVTGANRAETHLVHVDLARDAAVTGYADLREVGSGDPCPRCGGALRFPRGIEVGHVFNLGTKYSAPMQALYLDENGKEQEIVMGCYGIGVSRILAAAIEQNHDEGGIIFPPNIAPYEVALLCLDTKNETVRAEAEELYGALKEQGIDVLYDDRTERPGVKFKDADLIGLPLQVVFGTKGVARGVVEVKDRRTGEKSELPLEGLAEEFATWRETVWSAWGAVSRQ